MGGNVRYRQEHGLFQRRNGSGRLHFYNANRPHLMRKPLQVAWGYWIFAAGFPKISYLIFHIPSSRKFVLGLSNSQADSVIFHSSRVLINYIVLWLYYLLKSASIAILSYLHKINWRYNVRMFPILQVVRTVCVSRFQVETLLRTDVKWGMYDIICVMGWISI